MSFREGDFIETYEGLIFDVKGLVHPPNRVIAFVRYIPSPEGSRERGENRYLKVYDLSERFAVLRERFPQYLVFDPVVGEELIEVPIEKVAHHYSPRRKLAELQSRSNLSPLEAKALGLANFIADSAHVPLGKIGISGSLLVGLASSSSDLDLIIYDRESALKVSRAMKKHFEEGGRLKKYDIELLKTRYRDRCSESGVSFEDYAFHEQRKSFEGFFDGTEFFVRYVKDRGECEERYGENVYTPIGRAKICGMIEDDSDAIFTPCFYGVKDVEVTEGTAASPISGITSFRGRFCQQALTGERIVSCGKLERAMHGGKTSYRLIVGNRPEDFMVAVR